jgi:hypothetical protein
MKTKNRILYAGIIAVFLTFTACGGASQQKVESQNSDNSNLESMTMNQQDESKTNMHAVHKNLADNFAHKDIVILDNPYQLSDTAKTEMEQVIDAYLQVKNALVKDDVSATDRAVDLMAEKVASVVPTRLHDKGLEAWQNHQLLYETKLKEMKHSDGLENKRSYFSHLSEIMYCTIKSFGLKQGNLFAIYCPMAFDGEGAYWISDSKQIQNPYQGKKMPGCGEIKETL